MGLSGKDIKMIKYEKRIGYVFSASVLFFGALLNLLLILTKPDLVIGLLVLGDVAIIGFSIMISYLINRKYNCDLKAGEKIIKDEIVQKKEVQAGFEAGSGAMNIPILGDLFPKLWGQQMRQLERYILRVNGFKYDVEKELFDLITENEIIEFHYAKCSNTLLSIEPKNK